MRTGGDRGRKEDHLEGCSQSDCNESWCRDSLDAWNDVTQHVKQKLFISSLLPVGLTSFFMSSRRSPTFSLHCWLDFTRVKQEKKNIASLTHLNHSVTECEAAQMCAQAPPPEQLGGLSGPVFPWMSAVKGSLHHNIVYYYGWYSPTQPSHVKVAEIYYWITVGFLHFEYPTARKLRQNPQIQICDC